jgi:hypothetical protein
MTAGQYNVVLLLLHCLSVMLSYGYCIFSLSFCPMAICLSCCPMVIALSVCHVVLWLLYFPSVIGVNRRRRQFHCLKKRQKGKIDKPLHKSLKIKQHECRGVLNYSEKVNQSFCHFALWLFVCHVVLCLLHCLSVMLSCGYCIVSVILSYGYCIVCLSFCPMAIVLSVLRFTVSYSDKKGRSTNHYTKA